VDSVRSEGHVVVQFPVLNMYRSVGQTTYATLPQFTEP